MLPTHQVTVLVRQHEHKKSSSLVRVLLDGRVLWFLFHYLTMPDRLAPLTNVLDKNIKAHAKKSVKPRS